MVLSVSPLRTVVYLVGRAVTIRARSQSCCNRIVSCQRAVYAAVLHPHTQKVNLAEARGGGGHEQRQIIHHAHQLVAIPFVWRMGFVLSTDTGRRYSYCFAVVAVANIALTTDKIEGGDGG